VAASMHPSGDWAVPDPIGRGRTALLAGDLVAAGALLRSALQADASVDRTSAQGAAALLAAVSAVAGDLRAADDLLDRLDRGPGLTTRPRAGSGDPATIARIVLRLDRGHATAARDLVRVRAPESYHGLWPLALWAHVQFHLLSGATEDGLDLVARTEEAVLASGRAGDPSGSVPSGLARAVLAATRADLHLARGELRRAWEACDGEDAAWTGAAAAAVLYASGEFDAAQWWARARRVGPSVTERQRLRLRAVEGAAALAIDDADLAARLVARVRRSAAEQRWTAYAAHVPAPLRDVGPQDAGHTPRTSRSLVPPPVLSAPLSPRERAVLRLLLEDHPREVIASRLGVSLNTVKTQLASVYAKLGVTSRSEVRRRLSAVPPASAYAVD
jgi:LuxR family transcriptional regulator, maltose regulon positive regulatory protein